MEKTTREDFQIVSKYPYAVLQGLPTGTLCAVGFLAVLVTRGNTTLGIFFLAAILASLALRITTQVTVSESEVLITAYFLLRRYRIVIALDALSVGLTTPRFGERPINELTFYEKGQRIHSINSKFGFSVTQVKELYEHLAARTGRGYQTNQLI